MCICAIVGICTFLKLRRKTSETSRNICEDLFCFPGLKIAGKILLKTFFLENTCLCVLSPWFWHRALLSLASRGSVIGRAVLGFEFFCVLGLEPCVLDSTSDQLHSRIMYFPSTIERSESYMQMKRSS